MSAFHDLKLDALNGGELPLAPFKGQVVLVVNVASKCGLTPQYKALENLYQQYKDQGFSVLGLPCNQFAGQEPGTADEIKAFCSLNYGVTFAMTEPQPVSGANAIPLFKGLAEQSRQPRWNFFKYVVDRQGKVVASFSSLTKPDDPELIAAVEKAIASQP